MQSTLPISRLSPKNQVTLPREAKALAEAEAASYVLGIKHTMRQPLTGETFPVVMLLSEGELERREEAIRRSPGLDPALCEWHIARLRGNAQRMNIDAQRRIVLPPHLVQELGLQREAFLFATTTAVLVWNPEHWRRYDGAVASVPGQAGAPPPPPLPILML